MEKNVAKIVFEDYAGINEKLLEGFMVVKVSLGINAEETGLMMKLEREIDNVTLGVEQSRPH